MTIDRAALLARLRAQRQSAGPVLEEVSMRREFDPILHLAKVLEGVDRRALTSTIGSSDISSERLLVGILGLSDPHFLEQNRAEYSGTVVDGVAQGSPSTSKMALHAFAQRQEFAASDLLQETNLHEGTNRLAAEVRAMMYASLNVPREDGDSESNGGNTNANSSSLNPFVFVDPFAARAAERIVAAMDREIVPYLRNVEDLTDLQRMVAIEGILGGADGLTDKQEVINGALEHGLRDESIEYVLLRRCGLETEEGMGLEDLHSAIGHAKKVKKRKANSLLELRSAVSDTEGIEVDYADTAKTIVADVVRQLGIVMQIPQDQLPTTKTEYEQFKRAVPSQLAYGKVVQRDRPLRRGDQVVLLQDQMPSRERGDLGEECIRAGTTGTIDYRGYFRPDQSDDDQIRRVSSIVAELGVVAVYENRDIWADLPDGADDQARRDHYELSIRRIINEASDELEDIILEAELTLDEHDRLTREVPLEIVQKLKALGVSEDIISCVIQREFEQSGQKLDPSVTAEMPDTVFDEINDLSTRYTGRNGSVHALIADKTLRRTGIHIDRSKLIGERGLELELLDAILHGYNALEGDVQDGDYVVVNKKTNRLPEGIVLRVTGTRNQDNFRATVGTGGGQISLIIPRENVGRVRKAYQLPTQNLEVGAKVKVEETIFGGTAALTRTYLGLRNGILPEGTVGRVVQEVPQARGYLVKMEGDLPEIDLSRLSPGLVQSLGRGCGLFRAGELSVMFEPELIPGYSEVRDYLSEQIAEITTEMGRDEGELAGNRRELAYRASGELMALGYTRGQIHEIFGENLKIDNHFSDVI